MSQIEIQLGGLGGQGVVLAGMTLGRGLALYEELHVSLTQSFGPEARGSACNVQIIAARAPIFYPYLERPDILVTLSQGAFRRFAPGLKDGGLLLFEEELVKAEPLPNGVRAYGVPATRLAEELGRKMVMNMVVLGFFTAVTGLLRPESARRAVSESVPRGTEALNLAAFEKGYTCGLERLTAGTREGIRVCSSPISGRS
ncbi:MAG: 2-oxoacid:acceptor oxidoreductase family protein [Acidobacteria bacterium]|nr:2-oxoacid:acceptor oxidoreductase family protein [Acidobacteriota bacterium]